VKVGNNKKQTGGLLIDYKKEPSHCNTLYQKLKIRIMKIAITSSDGAHVDSFYKLANMIFIYDVDKNEIKSVEKRKPFQYYGKNQKQKLNWSTFERVYETIKDCKILYTQNIDLIPIQRFDLLGISVKQADGEIGKILSI
jgi:predicted Fe-Mo cluster-binding NifX family protein